MERILEFLAAHWEWVFVACVAAAGLLLGRKAWKSLFTTPGVQGAAGAGAIAGRDVAASAATAHQGPLHPRHFAEIPQPERRKLAETYGVTQAALKAFFDQLAQSDLSPGQPDGRLSEMAAAYRTLTARLAGVPCEDPAVSKLKERARIALEEADFPAAERALRESIEIDAAAARSRAEAYGKRMAAAAESWAEIGELENVRRRYSRAAECFGSAADLAAKVSKPYADYLDAQGTAFYRAGKYKEAEGLLNRAMGIREDELGPDHPDVAASLGGLAELYSAQGRLDEAEPLYRRALELLETSFGATSPRCVKAAGSLARLLVEMGGPEQARELQQEPEGPEQHSEG